MAVARTVVSASRQWRTSLLMRPAAIYKATVRDNSQHRVILLPEVPPDNASNNPLLKPYDSGELVNYDQVTERHCFFGLGKALLEFESAVSQLEDRCGQGVEDFDAIFGPLEKAKCHLESVWSSVNLLNLVTDSLDKDRFLQLHARAERAFLTRHNSRLIHDTLKKLKDKGGLSQAQERIVDRYLLEYKHKGYELSEQKFQELNVNWMRKVHMAKREYSFRMMNATERFRHTITDPNIVRDFPVDVLKAMGTDSTQPAKGPWTVTLHPYIYKQFMAYCPDRRIRYTAHVADVTRGCKTVDVYTNVVSHVKDIRQYRLDQASTLGYQNYAVMSMDTKMAGSVENVHTMIASLLGKAKQRQEMELENLQTYAESRGFDEDLEVFDIAYFKRKQRRTLLGVTEDDLREFFPFPRVLSGLFHMCSSLFNISFEEVTTDFPRWHPDVRLFKVTDGNKLLGQFFIDAYLRDDKGYAGGDKGWYVPIRHASKVGNSAPLGTLVMSLPAPNYGKPSLLSFVETEELLRNFGSLLLHILSESDYSDLAGKHGVEWDALELVGYFMTNWLYTPDVLNLLSSHWSTGEAIKEDIVHTICTTGRHQMAGYSLCVELYKAAYDLAFYSKDYDNESYLEIAERLRPQYLLLPTVKGDAFPMYFSDMLGGDSPAAIFTGTWAKMLAADAFSAVQEAVPLSTDDPGHRQPLYELDEVKSVANRFRGTFLSLGSARPMTETFRHFRGRDPSHEALLYSLGLKQVMPPKKKGQAAEM